MARLITRQEASELLECSPQTISNWVEKGVIKGHNIGRVLMIDRNSITKYFDTAKDIVILEKKLEDTKKDLIFEIKKSEDEIKNLKETLDCPGVPVKVFRTFMLSLIKISKHILTEKEFDIITRIMKGNKLETIGKKCGYSSYRILQIGLYSTQKIQSFFDNYDLLKEIEKLRKENERLMRLVSSKNMNIKGNEDSHSLDKSPFEMKINCFKLSNRTINALFSIGCVNLGDLVSLDKSTLRQKPNIGIKGMVELDDFIKKLGLKWGMDICKMKKKDIQILNKNIQYTVLNYEHD